jgi:hypothetical protein
MRRLQGWLKLIDQIRQGAILQGPLGQNRP